MTDLVIVPEVALFAMPGFQDVRLSTFTSNNPYSHFTCSLGSWTIEGDRRHRVPPKPPLSALG
jgi:hypothetical protein